MVKILTTRLGGKEGEERKEHDNCKKMEDTFIETNIDIANYTPGALLLTLSPT
jgi:hypothetical protein